MSSEFPPQAQEAESAQETYQPPEAWRKIYDGLPEMARASFRDVIEIGHLTPDLYRALNITCHEREHNEKLYPRDPESTQLRAAEVDYMDGEIRYFPAFGELAEGAQQHITAHELGHVVVTHLINPGELLDLLKQQPPWSLSAYMQELMMRPLHESENPSDTAILDVMHELAADFMADYLRSQTPEEMLFHRLLRVPKEYLQQYLVPGPDAEPGRLPQLTAEARETLLEPTRQLFAYFAKQLNPESWQSAEKAGQSYQLAWDNLIQRAHGVQTQRPEADLRFAVSGDVGETYWEATPQDSGQPKVHPDSFTSLLSELLGVDLSDTPSRVAPAAGVSSQS